MYVSFWLCPFHIDTQPTHLRVETRRVKKKRKVNGNEADEERKGKRKKKGKRIDRTSVKTYKLTN